MIANDQELLTVLGRIAWFQQQLAHLRQTEHNPANYRETASGFLAEIDRMQLEVRDYFCSPPNEKVTADEHRAVANGDPAVSVPDIPLRLDKHGDIRIGQSRVLLDTILGHYKAGMSPEEIARGYDTITLADVYETIGYYLRHKEDVEAYLERRDAEAEALRQRIEASQPSKADLKAQIKERWAKRKTDHAAPVD
jgi:uncharacterized protein (DUF433 family)